MVKTSYLIIALIMGLARREPSGAEYRARPPRDAPYGVVKNEDDRSVWIHFLDRTGSEYAQFKLEPGGLEGLPLQIGVIKATTSSSSAGRPICAVAIPQPLLPDRRSAFPRAVFFLLRDSSLT